MLSRFCLHLVCALSKNMGVNHRRVCLLPLPAAVQSDWLGEVREAKRRLLLTLWRQTGRICLRTCERVCSCLAPSLQIS